MEKVEVEFERESCMEEASKLLVGKLGRNSTEMYHQIVNLLIEDDPKKMKEDYRMQGGNYK